MTLLRDIIVGVCGVVGATVILLGLAIVLIRRFDTLWDLLRAHFLAIVQPVFHGVASARLHADVQGHLNRWIATLNRRLPVALSIPNVRIKYHDAASSMRVLEDGGILLLLDHNAPLEENYCRATTWIVGSTALPRPYRPYLPKFLTEAFELTVARLMLRDQNPRALAAFTQHVYEPAIADDETARYCARLETIDDVGFFTRILWPELHEHCQLHLGRHPTTRARDEAARFTRWLHAMSARRRGQLVPLRFESASINAAFDLVRDTQKDTPLSVHRSFIIDNLRAGFGRIYVCARGTSIPPVRQLAKEFSNDSRVARVVLYEFDQILIQQSVLDEAFKGHVQLPHALDGKDPSEFEGDPKTDRSYARSTVRAVCAVVHNAAPRVRGTTRDTAEVMA
jgi:hypothetical protein